MGFWEKALNWFGFTGDAEEEEETIFMPVYTGMPLSREDFMKMVDGVVAIEKKDVGKVELYRVGVKEYMGSDGLIWQSKGAWPVFDDSSNPDTSLYYKYPLGAYGGSWRAYKIAISNDLSRLAQRVSI